MMTRQSLQIVAVINAVVIALYSIVAWAGDYSPLPLTIAVIAAMALQVIVVVRPTRKPEDGRTVGKERSS